MRVILLVLMISLAAIAVVFAAEYGSPWQTVGDGIGYQEFHISTPDPINVYVARMDRANPSAIIDSAIGQGRISYGTEKVSDMVKRYDDSINFWGGAWGSRSQVVVAMNGSFFNAIGAPESGQIISGWYAKRFTDFTSSSGFVFSMNRSVNMGQCVRHDLSKQRVLLYRDGLEVGSYQIDGVNVPRGDNQLILYTPQYDTATHTSNDGAEVLVEMSRPTLLLAGPVFYAEGTVKKILDGKGQTLLPFDHIVLSASGAIRAGLLGKLIAGDKIRVSQEIVSYDRDCVSSYPLDWTKAYASIGGDFTILRDGQVITPDPQKTGAFIKNPRSVIAYDGAYIYFIVVDGRTPLSVGMTFNEVAVFARDTLGATWAITQDGGGSSVMVVNGQVKNHPVSACKVIFLPLIRGGGAQGAAAPNPTPPSTGLPTPKAPSSIYACERAVANAMMMIDVQPAQYSLAYAADTAISITQSTEIRLGPGSNYAVIAALPAGTPGKILTQPANLNGILAKGAHWWKVNFGSVEGWVDENAISKP